MFAKRLFKEKHILTVLATEQKKGFIYPVEIVIFIAVFLVINLLLVVPSFLLGILLFVLNGESGANDIQSLLNDPILSTIIGLFFTVVPAVCVILYCRFFEKRSLQSMGLRGKDFWLQYLKGALVGLVLFSGVIAIGVLCGGFRFAGVAEPVQALWLILFFLGFMIQGMEEELICRGYFMISLSRRSPLWLAVLTNSAVFAALHLLNPGVGPMPIFNLILFGLFASLYMLRTGNIWGAAAIHSVWNYVQGNFYGLPVSGMTDMPTLFCFEQTGSALVNGGTFGPEGGLPVTAVYLIGILLVLFLPEKRKETNGERI